MGVGSRARVRAVPLPGSGAEAIGGPRQAGIVQRGVDPVGEHLAQRGRVLVRRGDEDLGECGDGRRRRQRVPEERPAGRDLLRVIELPGERVADAVRAHRGTAGDRLADRDHIGLEPPQTRRAAFSHDVRVRLVERQHGPAFSGHPAELVVPVPLRRQEMDVVRERGLGEHEGDVLGCERGAQSLDIVELRDPHAAGHPSREAAL